MGTLTTKQRQETKQRKANTNQTNVKPHAKKTTKFQQNNHLVLFAKLTSIDPQSFAFLFNKNLKKIKKITNLERTLYIKPDADLLMYLIKNH